MCPLGTAETVLPNLFDEERSGFGGGPRPGDLNEVVEMTAPSVLTPIRAQA